MFAQLHVVCWRSEVIIKSSSTILLIFKDVQMRVTEIERLWGLRDCGGKSESRKKKTILNYCKSLLQNYKESGRKRDKDLKVEK
jgi:hypothetical protein